jgi:hypothetical protein
MALCSHVWYLGWMIKSADQWNDRSAISRWAHVFERIGLALAGGSCGLFVAANAARVDAGILSSPLAVLAIMLYGAAGFYLGIDLPAAPPDHRPPLPLTRNLGSRADVVELLSAAGTFLAAVAAVVSVSGIVLDDAVRTGTARLIIFAWAIGTTMQIGAGIMARTRAEPSTTS